jgi:hypothetical protein
MVWGTRNEGICGHAREIVRLNIMMAIPDCLLIAYVRYTVRSFLLVPTPVTRGDF